MGCPKVDNMNDFELADKMKEMSVGYYSALLSKNCKLNFKEATNVSSQVVAGTVYRFDAKILSKCGDGPEEIVICKNFKFFEPLSFNCNKPDGKCVDFLEKEKIACGSDIDSSHTGQSSGSGNFESEYFFLPESGGSYDVLLKKVKFGLSSEDDYDG